VGVFGGLGLVAVAAMLALRRPAEV